ncbi:MAG: hypothetical protein AMXMBFR47_09690 [Planctomycetota bacterium]
MLLPIGTDVRLRRRPIGNYALILANILVYVLADGMGMEALHRALPPLHAGVPALHEYITYQFRHGDVAHLIGNMLFLWIFGNAVCDRMGSLNYVIFYLASGVVAGVVYAFNSNSAMVGASGAIAAVTTAFLAFYPRVHITLLLWFLIVTVIQLPAMLVIGVKIILWDNIISPRLSSGMMDNVAYSAHLGGYAFGFAVAMLMLAVRALPRNQFDLLAIINRWHRRSGLTAEVSFQPPRTARPVVAEEVDSRPLGEPPSPAATLREDIQDRLAEHDFREAVRLYEKLTAADSRAVLPMQAQLDIANYLAREQRYPEAVGAYQGFLNAYPTAPESPQIHLLVGMFCNRYLGDPARAEAHLARAVAGLAPSSQRDMALRELQTLRPDSP